MAEAGWPGLPAVPPDGRNWPLDVAAKVLGMPEGDLRALVRILGVAPAGVIRTAPYARQGRHPRAYPAGVLLRIAEVVEGLRADLGAASGPPEVPAG